MLRIKSLAALLVVAATAVVAVSSPASGGSARETTIVQTAVADGRFETLAMLLERANLVSTLQKRGPYTVFAPTDAAFAKLPKSTLNALLRDRAKLRAVLLYHVVAGKVTAAKVVKLTTAKTVNGNRVRIRVSGGNVFVNRSKVTQPDVMAANGVIHVVNQVLIPPTA